MLAPSSTPPMRGDPIAKLQTSLRTHGRELDDISTRLSHALELCGAVEDHLLELSSGPYQDRGYALAFAGSALLRLVKRDMDDLTERLLHASEE